MSRSFFWFQQRNKRPLARALTLVEVIVTVTILAMVVAGVGAGFFSGLRLWDRVRNVDFARTEFLLNIGIISRDLRQSVDVPLIGFEGDTGSFSFPLVEKGAVVKVTYILGPATGEMSRRVKSLAAIVAGHEEKEVVTKGALMADKITFKYLHVDGGASAWVDAWTKDKGIFPAIRIEGVFKSEPFSKIIIVPVA